MIVLRHEHKVYYPKLDIRACLTIDKLFNDVTAPLYHYLLETQVLLLSLSLQRYNLTDDELYDLIDTVEDLSGLILKLYEESGIITLGEQQNSTDSDLEHDTEQSDDISNAITFESHMNDLLEQCMAIGMTEQEFYNSTLSEVTRYVNAYHKQQEYQLQEKAYFDYQLAGLIKSAIGGLINRKVKYPSLKEAYPFLNSDDEKNKKVDEEWELEKQHIKLMEWAEQMNKKFEKNEKE